MCYFLFSFVIKVTFAFHLYDLNDGGVLEVDEVQNMVKEVYGEEWKHNKHAKL